MTLSPPSNVKLREEEPARALAHGIDSLYLAVDLTWENNSTFEKLHALKAKAKVEEMEQVERIASMDGGADWIFTVKPHGAGGYEWLLSSHDMDIKLGDWLAPKSRPSAMVEIRSEALWTHGPVSCIDRVRQQFAAMAAKVVVMKASRADVCADVLVPMETWSIALLDHLVTRAETMHPHLRKRYMEGLTIGKGVIMARFYDKPLEICIKSHKDWMYHVWGIESVSEDHRIIRIEFQLRREAMKDLDIDTSDDLLRLLPNLWAYCTRQWLKVQDDPSTHHTQQGTLPWWCIVQAAVVGAQQAHPLIRAKAIHYEDQQNSQAILGYLTSKTANWQQGERIEDGYELDMASHLRQALDQIAASGMTDEEFTDRVKRKQVKKARAEAKYKAAQSARAELGLSLKPKSDHRRKS